MRETIYSEFDIASDDGVMLHGRDYPGHAESDRPILCLPGLTRNSRDFHDLALRLAEEGHRVIALDYRGRGLSGWDKDPANYNVIREARDVVAVMDALGLRKADFIGTSRGGLILHVLVGMIADRIGRVVLNDVGPKLELEGLRQIASYLGVRYEPQDFEEAARALQMVHGADFPALTPSHWNAMAHAVYRMVDGAMVADYDPALVESLKDLDLDQPLPELWEPFQVLASRPVLIIRGANSRLLAQETAERMAKAGPDITVVVVAGQGHAPILEHDHVWPAIRDFLRP